MISDNVTARWPCLQETFSQVDGRIDGRTENEEQLAVERVAVVCSALFFFFWMID